MSDHAARDVGTLDAWTLELGTGDKPDGRRARSSAEGGAKVKDRTRVTATDTPRFIPDAPENGSDAGVAMISVAPPPIEMWKARLGKAVASARHAFSRLEIDLAPQLVPTPKRAQVVFVIDRSHSQREEGVRAQLELVRAYLSHVPDAEVELVAFDRRAERVFGRFVPATDVGDALAVAQYRGRFARANGSHLDEGARLAASLLADRIGPRRVVLATDELVRSALTPTLALAALASLSPDTVVHVVVPELDGDDRPSLTRHDDAAFAALATRHHGIAVTLGGVPAQHAKALAPVVLELVRPTRIEHVVAPGFTLESDVLAEGSGVRLMIDTPRAPDAVQITGKVWSDPVTLHVRTARAFSISTAAFVFGADEHQQLSHAEQLTLALMGRAVSPVTSYVAAEPGVRPSTIGLEWGGLLGTVAYGTMGHGFGGGGGREPPDLKSLLDPSGCVDQHKPTTPWSVRLAVETTRDEIVDVTASSTTAMARCLAEQTWGVRLDARFGDVHQTYTVELSGSAAP